MVYIIFYPLGAYIIIITPTNAINPPIKSNLSGVTLSIFHPHKIDNTKKPRHSVTWVSWRMRITPLVSGLFFK